MSANERQEGGDHYRNKAIQSWDFIVANGMGYLDGCVVKYVSRFREKNGVQDLEKAAHFLAKLIEVEKEKIAALEQTGRRSGKYAPSSTAGPEAVK